ncbi:hypothetical protein [Dyadobacter sp. NIV53]|uniref:hypothetical protein n=1 Tax=Dyadobacter sp. NIV53 TaxID=2861765 RepID=UPI001C86B1C5|nr:hypothetical protein [Dyadobacter sp. NIV53]
MITTDVYFDTDSFIKQQVNLFSPVLEKWIGKNYPDYYLPGIDLFSYDPSEKFLISLSRNSSYNKTDEDCDRFRYKLIYIDLEGRFEEEENLKRISEFLKLLWSINIPTCTPVLEDQLPFQGGANGPVKWPL